MPKRITTAVILAAGRGTRLQPYTYDIPKGMMKIGEETLIGRSLRILGENGISSIIVGTGHLHEQYETSARNLGITTFLNPDFASTGSFHTLICGRNFIKDDFLLLESDLLYHPDAIQKILESEQKDVILCSGFTQSNDEVYVTFTDDGKLEALSKKKEDLRKLDGELVGIWKVSLSLYQELLKYHAQHGDATFIDYERAIAALNDHQVNVLKLENLVWCEIDDEAHLERAKKLIYPKLI